MPDWRLRSYRHWLTMKEPTAQYHGEMRESRWIQAVFFGSVLVNGSVNGRCPVVGSSRWGSAG